MGADSTTPKLRDVLEGVAIEYLARPAEVSSALSYVCSLSGDIGLDFETSPAPHAGGFSLAALQAPSAAISTIQLYVPNERRVFVLNTAGEPEKLEFFNEVFKKDSGRVFICFNALFELTMLRQLMLQPRAHCVDIGYKLLSQAFRHDINLHGGMADLGKALGYQINKSEQLSNWSGELTDAQVRYAAQDAVFPALIWPGIKNALNKNGLAKSYMTNLNALYAVAGMQCAGVGFNASRHKELVEHWEKLIEENEDVLATHFGPININSAVQISDWIESEGLAGPDWPRTKPRGKKNPKSALVVDNTQLKERLGEHPAIQELLEHRAITKLYSTYGPELAAHINPVTNRIHPSFRVCSTFTGRLSCSKPNLQNQPKGSGLRKLFVPAPGNKLIVADYSQIELRCAGAISGDEEMYLAYSRGEDLHRKTAAAIAGCSMDSVTKEMRQAAKAVNFGLLFGMGAAKLSLYARLNYGVHMTDAEAHAAVDAWRRLYQGYRYWQVQTTKQAEKSLLSTTPLGRKRKLAPDNYFSISLNTPVQGAAAEIMLKALARIDNALIEYNTTEPEFTAALVNCIHDEFITECSERVVAEVKPIVEKEMVTAFSDVFPEYPSGQLVEAHVGDSWEEAKG